MLAIGRLTRLCLGIFVILQVHFLVAPLRLKIAVERTIESDGLSSRTKRSASACSNYNKIDPNTISCNLSPKPWYRSPAVTFVSESVTQGMDKALMARVPGLGKTTIRDVFDRFEQHGCFSLPFGGCVRDQFLGSETFDIDADTPCELDVVVKICEKYWSSKYCKPPAKKAPLQIMHIGEINGREIDLANWKETFLGKLTNLEYTTNSLGYYSNGTDTSVVIDLSGTGVADTCSKTIRIPVQPDEWESWYNRDSYKIFRYWKLRSKGYTTNDHALTSFIKDKTMEILGEEKGVYVFKKTFCKYAFTGDYHSKTYTCTIPDSSCEKQNKTRSNYYALYEEVLGELWKNEAKKMLDEVRVECLWKSYANKTKQGFILILFSTFFQYFACLHI